ncbi:MAG TPA: uracil-DNA glycosylase, partial [Clostridia bacterium]|nr:uracil-DNA glycosylase [Clostridia bacterium]
MYDNWKSLNDECTQCTKCDLSQIRTNVVIGRGNTDAKVILIGEGPGEQEDMSDKPFVGAAGQLLDILLEALMFKPDSYYIANIVKCRPPKNRVPSDAEAEKCLPYLRNQVMLIKPKIIVCLGAVATKYIIDKDAKITRIRGNWIERNKFAILPTFHPAALLRDE